MKVLVHLYAQLRDLAAMSEQELELSEGATVGDLLEVLYKVAPALRARDKSTLVAAGVEFVDRSYIVKAEEEISVMPPVQGG